MSIRMFDVMKLCKKIDRVEERRYQSGWILYCLHVPEFLGIVNRRQLSADTATDLLRSPPVDGRIHVEQVAVAIVQLQTLIAALGGDWSGRGN